MVGSPDRHGPHQVRPRDGHYTIDLALWLGEFATLARDFSVKLDVDVKAEKSLKENLILVGGILTNLITSEVNSYLPVKFETERYPFRKLISSLTGKNYTEDECGLVAKIVNPFDSEKAILILAGIRWVGTKAAVLALTRLNQGVLKNYQGEDNWARVVRGLDLDGDGKLDSVRILE